MSNLARLLDAAEARKGLPPGLMASIVAQETGGNSKYLDDPSAYHYGLDKSGKRVAGHTGKVSTAFGPFGLLDSTGAKPGYGVEPLKDKSLGEQVRFATDYIAARINKAGDIATGLAGYGEGPKYAEKVLSRLGWQPNNAVSEVTTTPTEKAIRNTTNTLAPQPLREVVNTPLYGDVINARLAELRAILGGQNKEGGAGSVSKEMSPQQPVKPEDINYLASIIPEGIMKLLPSGAQK
jgi:hypothetical protein